MKSLYVSGNFTSILGYAKEDFFIERWWRDNIHPEDQPKVYAELDTLLKNGSASFDYRFKHKDERWLWMHTDCNLLYGQDGKPSQIAGTWRDITEELTIKELSRQNNERFQLAYKGTKDAIYDLNLVTHDLWFSNELFRSYGYDEDSTDTTVEWVCTRIHPDDYKEIEASVTHAMECKQQTWAGEYRFVRADGSYANIFDRGIIVYCRYYAVETNRGRITNC